MLNMSTTARNNIRLYPLGFHLLHQIRITLILLITSTFVLYAWGLPETLPSEYLRF
jgi:hypothetical protein